MARPRGHRLSLPAFEDTVARRPVTVTELAEQTGIPRATLSSLIGGHHRASLSMVRRIADALLVQPGTLFPTTLPQFIEAEVQESAA
jgi:DNA-binding Xre family transcriptional regulator